MDALGFIGYTRAVLLCPFFYPSHIFHLSLFWLFLSPFHDQEPTELTMKHAKALLYRVRIFLFVAVVNSGNQRKQT